MTATCRGTNMVLKLLTAVAFAAIACQYVAAERVRTMKAAENVNEVSEIQKFNGSQGDDAFKISETKPKVCSHYSSFKSLSPYDILESGFNQKLPSSLSDVEKWCDDIPLGQKCLEDKYMEINSKQTRDIGTMTDHSLAKYLELKTKGNELFGQMVACEISNIDGKERYDKMKEIIGLFQTLNN